METETAARQLAHIAGQLQTKRTGHAPRAVSVVLSDDTLVVTLYGALTLAEQLLARSSEGAAQVQEYHRQLFANTAVNMQHEITRITGRQVREAAAEIELSSGTVVHAFTTGSMVQVFLLTPIAGGGAAPVEVHYVHLIQPEADGPPTPPQVEGAK